jgi:flagellar biosynthesis/type III secretory pathway protein FliH
MNVGVIKVRTSNGAPAVSRITKEAHEASLEAKDILARAHEQAAQLIEDARQERDKVIAESTAQGYAAGLNQWNDALAEAWQRRDVFLARNEAELVKLAVAVARKVIGNSIEVEQGAVLHSAIEVLRSVRSERRVTIKVNPADEAALRDQAASLKMLGAEVGELVIVGLPSIEAGGCIVESDLGIIDAQVATQLASIENALLRRFDDGSR